MKNEKGARRRRYEKDTKLEESLIGAPIMTASSRTQFLLIITRLPSSSLSNFFLFLSVVFFLKAHFNG